MAEKAGTMSPPWKLNVQGVQIELRRPSIAVRDAIKLAGFDPEAGWIIVLKIEGQPKKPVELDYVINLRQPGIEKLRLTPKQIDNGEASQPRRCQFALLPQDEAHLERLGLRWETVLDGQRRWLFLHAYPLPGGYTLDATNIAIEYPDQLSGRTTRHVLLRAAPWAGARRGYAADGAP